MSIDVRSLGYPRVDRWVSGPCIADPEQPGVNWGLQRWYP